MSRFLDAMRERGNRAGPGDGSVPDEEGLPVTVQTADDKTTPSYKGQIVDVDDVLGTPVKPDDTRHTEPAVETAVDSGDEAISNQAEEQTPQLSIQNDESSATRVSDSQSVTPTPAGAAELNASAGAAAPRGYTGDSLPGRQKFGVRSLDPLFYLIVGVAALGLFGSLYALITQNDAYFEREYQQLQKESAALQARLAASASLQSAEERTTAEDKINLTSPVELTSPVDLTSAEVVALQVDPATENSDSTLSQTAVTELPVAVDPVTVAEVAPGTPAAAETPLAVESGAASDTTESSTDEETNNQVLDLLRQEVEGLRALIAAQDDKIVLLQQEKPVQSPRVDSGPGDQAVVVKTANGGVVQVESIASSAVGVDTGISRPAEVRRTPVLTTPQVGADDDINNLVNRGYLAYQAADYVTAGQLYQKALQFDPYHRDANLGVAAVAQISGRLKLSEDRYRHLLTLNPADAVAFSALLNLGRDGTSANLIEYELAQHARYVDKPQMLYAILGNYYSQQQRWLEAGQAYSVAVTGDNTSADSLFNYAVSLDNLERVQQAADFYSKALTAASYGSYSFDISAVQQRLKSIDITSQ